ncbi:Uncharacterised protein [Mycobacteroides abscessus subsp. abscessus]|nr:Uncharacterised protein [Mycobacteroides abscessus subsp. abscessus]
MREQRVQQPPSQALFLVCRIHTDGVNLVLGRVTPQPGNAAVSHQRVSVPGREIVNMR